MVLNPLAQGLRYGCLAGVLRLVLLTLWLLDDHAEVVLDAVLVFALLSSAHERSPLSLDALLVGLFLLKGLALSSVAILELSESTTQLIGTHIGSIRLELLLLPLLQPLLDSLPRAKTHPRRTLLLRLLNGIARHNLHTIKIKGFDLLGLQMLDVLFFFYEHFRVTEEVDAVFHEPVVPFDDFFVLVLVMGVLHEVAVVVDAASTCMPTRLFETIDLLLDFGPLLRLYMIAQIRQSSHDRVFPKTAENLEVQGLRVFQCLQRRILIHGGVDVQIEQFNVLLLRLAAGR